MPDPPEKPTLPSPPEPIVRQVRKFESRHAPGVAAILRQSPEAAEWSLKSIEQLDQRGEVAWVVDRDGFVGAFLVARAVARDAEILNLCVHPQKRRSGNATALLQAAIAEFQRLRVQTVFLEVRESNLPAISFYGKLGFVRNGRRRAYYRNPSEDAVLMMRELTA